MYKVRAEEADANHSFEDKCWYSTYFSGGGKKNYNSVYSVWKAGWMFFH